MHRSIAGDSQPPVHLLWDWDTLPCPPSHAASGVLARLQQLAERYGRLATATMLTAAHTAEWEARDIQQMRDKGVSIEELRGEEQALLTRLLHLTLQLQKAAASASSPALRPSVIVLSSLQAVSASLSLMRQSGLFGSIVLVHGLGASRELILSASAAVPLDDFLCGSAPVTPTHAAAATTDESASSSPTGSLPITPPNDSGSSSSGMSSAFAHLQLHTSPTADDHSLLGVPPGLSAGPIIPSPRNSVPLLPTPSPHSVGLSSAPSSTTPTVRYLSHSSAPSPLHSSSGHGKSFAFPPGSGRNKIAASAPSSPTGSSSQHQRSFFPSTMSPSHVQQQHGGMQSRGSHAHGHSHMHVSAARTRACVSVYQRIIAYCESEKLIPRESVLKKRLVDSRADMGASAAAGMAGDFEEFLFIVTQVAGVGVMEGEAPQRIVWPRGPDGGPRRFPCADFFTPQARLTPAQHAALMEFLYRVQPEVERGRFGFATYLARHGPPFIQRMPHGVLVELVQLLLNCPLRGTQVTLADGGVKRVEELVPGVDRLAGTGGVPVTVISAEPGVSSRMYTITHDDETSFTVTPQHRCTLVWTRNTVIEETSHTGSSNDPALHLSFWVWQDGQPTSSHAEVTAAEGVDGALAWLDLHHPLANTCDGQAPAEGSRLECGTIFEMTAAQLACVYEKVPHMGSVRESRHAVDTSEAHVPPSSPTSFRPDGCSASSKCISISSVRLLEGEADIVSVEVDGDHRYQLADGTLTHNSKTLLFRKGKVSVASKSEAIEAQSLGLFFTADNFLTPSASTATSAVTSRAVSPTPSSMGMGAASAAGPIAPEQSIWSDSPPPANLASSTHHHAGDEASIWSSPAGLPSSTSTAQHIDRSLLQPRRGSIGAGPLYAPFPSSAASMHGSMGSSGSSRHLNSSYSVPASRATSPGRMRSPPSHPHQRYDPLAPLAPQQPSGGGGDFSKMPLPHRKSIPSLQPLPMSLPLVTARVNSASGFDAPPGGGGAFKATPWMGSKDSHHTFGGGGGAGGSSLSAGASLNTSRRSSMSDIDNATSWRATAPVRGAPATGQQQQQQQMGSPPSLLPAIRFEQHTGGVTSESQDACDPAAVLAAKLSELNRGTLELLTGPAASAVSSSAVPPVDDLTRFTAAVQFRATFHFEKSGAAHTPEWVAVLTFCVGSIKYMMNSQTHSKKDAAKADVAMRALMAIEDNALEQVPHVDMLAPDPHSHIPIADPVVDLARLLNFLQQAPVVYYLSRALPLGAGGSRVGGSRLDVRRGSTGMMAMHSRQGSGSQQQQQQQSTLWNATARIQVKSVNVLTGEAQPTVSASTPFSHTVQGCATKQEAKQMIAASLLSQIERARVVNAALFTVLAAANSTRLLSARPFAAANGQGIASAVSAAGPSMASPGLKSLWSAPSSTSLAPISVPSSHSLPAMDLARINASSASSSSSSSLFSMHTPVPGRPFEGISSIGLSTPQPQASPPSHLVDLPPLARSVSEIVNEEAESISIGAAESALHETPTQ